MFKSSGLRNLINTSAKLFSWSIMFQKNLWTVWLQNPNRSPVFLNVAPVAKIFNVKHSWIGGGIECDFYIIGLWPILIFNKSITVDFWSR